MLPRSHIRWYKHAEEGTTKIRKKWRRKKRLQKRGEMWAESEKKRKVPQADIRMQGYPGWEKKTSFFIFFDYFYYLIIISEIKSKVLINKIQWVYGIVLGNKHISELECILIF